MPNYNRSNAKKQKNHHLSTPHEPLLLHLPFALYLIICYKEVGIKILIQPEHLPINYYCELHRYFCMIICLNQKKYILLKRKL